MRNVENSYARFMLELRFMHQIPIIQIYAKIYLHFEIPDIKKLEMSIVAKSQK